jgi:hypothetical protein
MLEAATRNLMKAKCSVKIGRALVIAYLCELRTTCGRHRCACGLGRRLDDRLCHAPNRPKRPSNGSSAWGGPLHLVRSSWTASYTSTVRRLFVGLLLFFIPFASRDAPAKGGTNFHERLPVSRTTVPIYRPPIPDEVFGGCGRGRYRDPRASKCRGPADFGN